MESFKKLFKGLLMVAVMSSLVACAQKKDDKKTRLNPGLGGAAGVAADPATQQLQNQFNNNGTLITVNSITKNAVNAGYLPQDQYWDIKSTATIGSDTRTIETPIGYGQGLSSIANGIIGGLQVEAQGYCEDYQCNWYYLNLIVRQNGQVLYQVGILRDFQYNNNLYKIQQPPQILQTYQLAEILANAYNSMY